MLLTLHRQHGTLPDYCMAARAGFERHIILLNWKGGEGTCSEMQAAWITTGVLDASSLTVLTNLCV